MRPARTSNQAISGAASVMAPWAKSNDGPPGQSSSSRGTGFTRLSGAKRPSQQSPGSRVTPRPSSGWVALTRAFEGSDPAWVASEVAREEATSGGSVMVLGRMNARLAAAALAVGALSGAAQGQATEQWSLSPTAGTTTQRFGLSMVVKGDVMVVGAPYEDTQGVDAGAIDVYRWDVATNNWKFEQQLFASDPEASARFGTAVSVDGNVLVVGAPFKDTTNGTDGGQIYVFRYNTGSKTWSQEQKLIPSVGAGDNFGNSVAISGNAIIS